jgi:hypothetical protein
MAKSLITLDVSIRDESLDGWHPTSAKDLSPRWRIDACSLWFVVIDVALADAKTCDTTFASCVRSDNSSRACRFNNVADFDGWRFVADVSGPPRASRQTDLAGDAEFLVGGRECFTGPKGPDHVEPDDSLSRP